MNITDEVDIEAVGSASISKYIRWRQCHHHTQDVGSGIECEIHKMLAMPLIQTGVSSDPTRYALLLTDFTCKL